MQGLLQVKLTINDVIALFSAYLSQIVLGLVVAVYTLPFFLTHQCLFTLERIFARSMVFFFFFPVQYYSNIENISCIANPLLVDDASLFT